MKPTLTKLINKLSDQYGKKPEITLNYIIAIESIIHNTSIAKHGFNLHRNYYYSALSRVINNYKIEEQIRIKELYKYDKTNIVK